MWVYMCPKSKLNAGGEVQTKSESGIKSFGGERIFSPRNNGNKATITKFGMPNAEWWEHLD